MNVLGVDVSKYNCYSATPGNMVDSWNPDRATMPISFVIQRASYASNYPNSLHEDEAVDYLWNQVKKISVRGAYHYFGSGYNYLRQIDVFLKAIEDKDYHFLVVDYEKTYNVLDKRTCAEFFEMIKKLKEITGKRVLAYFNRDIYNNYMKPFGTDSIISKYEVWYAQYPWAAFLNWNNPPSVPAGVNMKLWQGIGGDVFGCARVGKEYGTHSRQNGIDVNLWLGTLAELYEWANVSEVPPIEPPPPPIIIGKSAIVVVSSLNVRSGAGTQFSISSTSLKFNDKITILFTQLDNYGNLWGNFGENKWVCMVYRGITYVKYDEGVVVIPPVVVTPPDSKLGTYRVKHDLEYPMSERPKRSLGYIPGKPNSLRGLPEPRRLNGGNKGNIVLSKAWDAYIKKINTVDGYRFVTKQLSGWLNRGQWPQVEQLTFGGNFVDVYKIEGNKYFVRTYFNDQPPPQGIESFTLTQKFSVVYTDGHWVMGTDTAVGMVYIVLMAKPGEQLWMDKNDLVKV